MPVCAFFFVSSQRHADARSVCKSVTELSLSIIADTASQAPQHLRPDRLRHRVAKDRLVQKSRKQVLRRIFSTERHANGALQYRQLCMCEKAAQVMGHATSRMFIARAATFLPTWCAVHSRPLCFGTVRARKHWPTQGLWDKTNSLGSEVQALVASLCASFEHESPVVKT